MWIIAGLGNPGRKYHRTRHNVGFLVADELSSRYKIDLRKKEDYKIGRGSINKEDVILIEPLLFMNMSGKVIEYIIKKFDIQPEKTIIIHDDIDMQTGKIRIRKTGSSGGHKGVESIIQSIRSKDFIRIKIGVGREQGVPVEEYVLSKFNKQEMCFIKEAIQKAADAVVVIISEGVNKAMNRFN
ncbi:MAG: aminoacyl-tRNA hydrolase [Nitrospirae bacterium]|nr:aminoacyl-tRNA hydrolase [Nitrospirota bacterium]